MHEISLLRGLLTQIESIAREHCADRVTVVRLKLGPLAHIDPGHLREHFVEASRGTAASEARLEIQTTDELHELTLESVDLEPGEPQTSIDDRLPTAPAAARPAAPIAAPALEAMAAKRRRARPHDRCRSCVATGGHLKVAPAIWTGAHVAVAESVGDMDDAESRSAFGAAIAALKRRYAFDPETIACDLHPDYYTTRWAAEQGKPVVPVQHHHAHAVACMVEHDLLDREVVAVTWDGTGFGPDGTIWGGEILRARVDGFARAASLAPFPLLGGEAAIRNPNRVAFAMLIQCLGAAEVIDRRRLHERLGLSHADARILVSMIERDINSPKTSSVGRLFDAVAAIVLGIRRAQHEGEAAMRLESVADSAIRESYELPAMQSETPGEVARADWRPMMGDVLRDVDNGVPSGVIAARFHNALARWAAAVAIDQPPRAVVLSGGCFWNRLLTQRTVEAMRAIGRRVFCHERIPPGDGGLAVGQLAVAMSS